MSCRFAVTLVVVAALGLAGSMALAQERKAGGGGCVLAGGEATMLTGDMARFMANAALKNSISGKGLKPSGEIKMTCKDGTASVYCLAQQRACK